MQLVTSELGLAAATGAALGLSSLPHCAAMCGPVSAAVCGRAAAASAGLRYQLGRLLGYGFAGQLAAQAGAALAPLVSGPWARWLMTALVVGSALPLALRLLRPSRARVVPAERLARGSRGGVARLLPREPVVLGALSALLPCGALYAALAIAATTQRAHLGVALMVAFAGTSGLGLGVVSELLRRVDAARRPLLARLAAVALLLCAAFWLVRPGHAMRAAPADVQPSDAQPAHSCH